MRATLLLVERDSSIAQEVVHLRLVLATRRRSCGRALVLERGSVNTRSVRLDLFFEVVFYARLTMWCANEKRGVPPRTPPFFFACGWPLCLFKEKEARPKNALKEDMSHTGIFSPAAG